MNQAYYEQVRKIENCKKLGISEGQWSYIKRIGSILRQLYENDCNGFQDYKGNEDVRAKKRNDYNTNRYERIAKLFAGNNQLYIYLQGDCRGATIYLDKKPIPENDYTKAVCIY